jgi:hypothetical protein
MPSPHARELRRTDNAGGMVRIHAFEFGSLHARESGESLQFHDLRMTHGFPASAAWRARLGGLDVRAKDLWRLVHRDCSDGAIIVWPACPERKRVRLAIEEDDAVDSPATRVISLIRVSFPAVRAARWRASLNVRSIAVAETDWQRYAPALAARAPSLLRTEFDRIIAADREVRVRLPDVPDAIMSRAASTSAALLHSMASRRPIELGRDEVESESDFWGLVAKALAALPAEVSAQLSIASGLARPFLPEAVRYVPDTENVDTANSAKRDIVKDLGIHAREIVRQFCESSAAHQPSALSNLDLLDAIASVGSCPPSADSSALSRERVLAECEDCLIACFARDGFLRAAELHRLRSSPVLAALAQRAIDGRPHAIVARLQVSLTMLAHAGAGVGEILDDCLRVLLPPRWPASEWLDLFDADWAVRRALTVLRWARGQIPEHEFTDIERALVNRLSCSTLPNERAHRRALACVLPAALDRPIKHPA